MPDASGMHRTRKAGLIVAGIAAAMWLGALGGFLTTRPQDGVNIGAAMLAFVAVPVSIGASVTLLASLRGAPSGRPRILLAATVLAGLSLIAFPAFLLLDPYGTPLSVQMTALGVGVVAFLASSVLFALASRRSRAPVGAGSAQKSASSGAVHRGG